MFKSSCVTDKEQIKPTFPIFPAHPGASVAIMFLFSIAQSKESPGLLTNGFKETGFTHSPAFSIPSVYPSDLVQPTYGSAAVVTSRKKKSTMTAEMRMFIVVKIEYEWTRCFQMTRTIKFYQKTNHKT